jgi:uncharacterized membrane protein
MSTTAIQFLKNVNKAIINPLIVLLFGIALLVFIYGVFEYVKGGQSEDGRSKGTQHMIWGIFGLFIMVSALGLVSFIANSVGADTSTIRQVVPL